MENRANIEIVAQALANGSVALLPTETVWGLAARADHADAIAQIYALKGRDDGKPLAVCVRDLAQAKTLGGFSETAEDLANLHWPGSLTLVVPAQADTGLHAKTRARFHDMDTIALRCPDIGWRGELCDAPLALTSANRSGEPAATTKEAARTIFTSVPVLSAPQGLTASKPSTIARVIGETVEILRQGDLIL